ncbi:MAG TPA: hypothetical protein VF533_02665 [Solirubrobacteraceae bacterium]|jgi:hypothetical protein
MAGELEALLRQALAPVEPPAELEARLEDSLASIVEKAADELDAFEITAMQDPRNWPEMVFRPAAAVVVGGVAAVGLIAVRTQRKRHRRAALASGPLELAERTLRDAAHEARRLADEGARRRSR